jgi:hypothetical protein
MEGLLQKIARSLKITITVPIPKRAPKIALFSESWG